MTALEKANQVRFTRARLKRELDAKEIDIKDLIVDMPQEIETATVYEMIHAQHRWGRVRTRKLLKELHISETYTMAQLTDRQKGMLLSEL